MRNISNLENQVTNLKIFDYNMMLTSKFKYLKTEACNLSDVIVLILNIFDKKGLDNFKKTFAEKDSAFENNNSSKKSIVTILLKSTSNFLIKISENKILENFKSEIEPFNLGNKFIEIEEPSTLDTDKILNEIIRLSKF